MTDTVLPWLLLGISEAHREINFLREMIGKQNQELIAAADTKNDLRAALDRANKLIGEAANEATVLRAALAERDAQLDAAKLAYRVVAENNVQLARELEESKAEASTGVAALSPERNAMNWEQEHGAIADAIPLDEWAVGGELLSVAVARIVAERDALRATIAERDARIRRMKNRSTG